MGYNRKLTFAETASIDLVEIVKSTTEYVTKTVVTEFEHYLPKEFHGYNYVTGRIVETVWEVVS